MWLITPDDAAEMYKRFLLARYRDGALVVATEQAARFSSKGESSVSEIWSRIATKIQNGQSNTSKSAF